LSAIIAVASSAQAETLRIAMIVWRGETPAEAGFRDGLTKLGYTADFTVINANQDRAALRDKLEKFVLPRLNSFDYIYSFGTTASKMTLDLVGGRIPVLFDVVTAPVEAGLVQQLDNPGGNVSGATNTLSLQTQIQAAMGLFPIKKLGLPFNPREKNTMVQREQLIELAAKNGIEIVEFRAPPALDMLHNSLQQLSDNSVAVDAVYLPSDSFLISQANVIGASLRAAKIRSIGAVKDFVSAGALMGVISDYHQLGMSVAAIFDRNRKGEPLGRIPVHVPQEGSLVINEQTRAALDLKVPDQVLAKAEIVR
jgi:ABC-type uncharacterized transport system substrate-binding protein